VPQYSKLAKVKWINYFENLFSVINSIQTCQFTTFGYLLEPPIVKFTPKILLKLIMTFLPSIAQMFLDLSLLSNMISAITGRKISQSQLLKAGKRIYILERYMNCLMGITKKDDTLPERFLKESETKHPVKNVVPLEPLLNAYYKEKGYSKDEIPLEKTLKKLGITQPEGLNTIKYED